jgi:outer membrane protein assembly factor BamB
VGEEQTESDEDEIELEEMSGEISGAPMFRYNAANTGTDPDETGPQTSVGELWTFQTGDFVRSSPAIVDNTVYVGSKDGSVYALSAADGTEQWAYQTDDSVYSSPTVVDVTVYVGGRDNNVYALSAEDGTEQWSYQTGAGVESSPTVVDDTVYIGSGYEDGNLYALSADDALSNGPTRLEVLLGRHRQ